MSPRDRPVALITTTCKRALASAALVFSATLGACHLESKSGACALGPCGPPTNQYSLSLVGFPADKVDVNTVVGGGYRGTMHVGESVTLYLVNSISAGYAPADTIRTGVVWALSDSTAARIAVDAQGGGRITAITVGVVGKIFANMTQYDVVFACFNYTHCDRVTELAVIP